MQPGQRFALFNILERYRSAVETIAFPLPQGFSSFFSYLGYQTLNYDVFIQYVERNVLELQIDVLKAIFKALGNSLEATQRKHCILTKVPRVRACRLLYKMHDSKSLRIMGNQHANAILCGAKNAGHRINSKSVQMSKYITSKYIILTDASILLYIAYRVFQVDHKPISMKNFHRWTHSLICSQPKPV